jgi:hypothetical protein
LVKFHIVRHWLPSRESILIIPFHKISRRNCGPLQPITCYRRPPLACRTPDTRTPACRSPLQSLAIRHFKRKAKFKVL